MISNLRQNKHDEMIFDLAQIPVELQNKIFFYAAEHPLASASKKEIEGVENDKNRRLYWKATDEYIRTTYLSEDGMISFILEDNIRTRNTGIFTMSHNDYVDNDFDYDTEDENDSEP